MRPSRGTWIALLALTALLVFAPQAIAQSTEVPVPDVPAEDSFGGPALWVGFGLFVAFMLALDLGVFHRKAHAPRTREALAWSVLWVGLALLFFAGIYHFHNEDRALEFLTAYLLEESLSVDNLFVFLIIFRYFRVAPEYQHRVLFWGILGAIAMRLIMIASGVALVQHFHWLFYIFGLFLIFTGGKLLFSHDNPHPEHNPVLKWFRKVVPTTPEYDGAHFTVSREGRRFATPLLAVLVLVETSDLLFATDSIPAVLGVSKNTFVVYTSNVFAILGLRSLYFLLARIMDKFRFLKYGLGLVLMFIGVKMVIAEGVLGWEYEIPIGTSLIVLAAVLATAMVASLAIPAPPGMPKDESLGLGAPGAEVQAALEGVANAIDSMTQHGNPVPPAAPPAPPPGDPPPPAPGAAPPPA